jgi:serine protease Do
MRQRDRLAGEERAVEKGIKMAAICFALTPGHTQSWKSVAAGVVISLLFWDAALTSSFAGTALSPRPKSSSPTLPGTVGVPLSFTDIAARAMPAVVNISTRQRVGLWPMPGPFGEEDPLDEFFRRYFGEKQPPTERQSLGSGFIVSTDGYIVTNNHVIANAKQITVRLARPHNEEYEATVVGFDELTDLALIKIAARRPLPTIPLGRSADLRIGEWVIAIGNPFGLDQTVTAGIVSAKGRVIGAGPYDDFIQTDASINPGNSGGPLLNLLGEVVGVNSAILSRAGGNIGIGFAIPIDMVNLVIAQLKATGKVTRGWLGVAVQAVTPDIARLFGLAEPKGALISEVAKGGPAEAAGIRPGDIIVTFKGIGIKDSHELPAIVARSAVGERVKVGVYRDGRETTFTVMIGELPSGPTKAEQEDRREEVWGMTVANIFPDIARRFRLEPGREGVVVIAITPGSPAERAGMRVGDVIEEVNRQPIRSRDDFDDAIAATRDKDSVLFLTRRGDSSAYRVLRKMD